jgi:8-amino-7-oxononanoate synthase
MEGSFREQLDALRDQSLYRQLREIGTAQGATIDLNGQRLANFASNDYLGLANDPRLRAAAIATINEFGAGAGASRLVSGTQSPHLRLERTLADWKRTEAALTFSSGYAAAVGTIPVLVTPKDVVILDKLCHASLIDGVKLSGAIRRVFPHNHLGKLQSHLAWARRSYPEARILILTESVFSMDGDVAPLRELVELKQRSGALLMLDEAHAIGVLGPNGRGLAAETGLGDQIDIQMGTLSKALGVSGGYIAGSRDLIDWLINRARSFIFSTAQPPALAGAAHAAVQLLNSEEGEGRRRQLAEKIRLLSETMPPPFHGEKSGEQVSAIFPWIVGDEEAAVNLSQQLLRDGFLVPAIRYPTVAKGAARLRITVTSAHEESQIRALGEAMARLRANLD